MKISNRIMFLCALSFTLLPAVIFAAPSAKPNIDFKGAVYDPSSDISTWNYQVSGGSPDSALQAWMLTVCPNTEVIDANKANKHNKEKDSEFGITGIKFAALNQGSVPSDFAIRLKGNWEKGFVPASYKDQTSVGSILMQGPTCVPIKQPDQQLKIIYLKAPITKQLDVIAGSDNILLTSSDATLSWTPNKKLVLDVKLQDNMTDRGIWYFMLGNKVSTVEGTGNLNYTFDDIPTGNFVFNAKFYTNDLHKVIEFDRVQLYLPDATGNVVAAPLPTKVTPTIMGNQLFSSGGIVVQALPNNRLSIQIKPRTAANNDGTWYFNLGPKMYQVIGKEEVTNYEISDAPTGSVTLMSTFIPATGDKTIELDPISLSLGMIEAGNNGITNPNTNSSATGSTAPISGGATVTGNQTNQPPIIPASNNANASTPATSNNAPAALPGINPAAPGIDANEITMGSTLTYKINPDGKLVIHAMLNNGIIADGMWHFNLGGKMIEVPGNQDTTYTVPDAPVGTYQVTASFVPNNGGESIVLQPLTVSVPTIMGGQLPNTATPWYNTLLLSLAILTLGIFGCRRGIKFPE